MDKVILIDSRDNVVTALEAVAVGETLEVATPAGAVRFTVRQAVEMGHKLAIAPVDRGGQIIKYGSAIGDATADIAAGDHVHSHNLSGYRGKE